MIKNERVLSGVEKAVNSLCALYESFGFSQYKMSKFEEYDLYAKNKDFLVSENVITFTDTDGKLMALKPDVTLSIIKNAKESVGVNKLFYNETVYRVSKGTKSFKEFMQVGLECLGIIDEYEIIEVLMLAAKSLETISSEYALDISHLGIVKGVLESANISLDGEKQILTCLSDKNAQGVRAVCELEGVEKSKTEILEKLVSVYGAPNIVISELKKLSLPKAAFDAVSELERLVGALEVFGVKNLSVDFSVVNDVSYYNGVVFKGFISGIPTGILSGGEYDKLMQKMGKKSRAIGFAVYLDELEKLNEKQKEFDVDVLVVYADSNINGVCKVVKEITDGGETVFAAKTAKEKIKAKRVVNLLKGGN